MATHTCHAHQTRYQQNSVDFGYSSFDSSCYSLHSAYNRSAQEKSPQGLSRKPSTKSTKSTRSIKSIQSSISSGFSSTSSKIKSLASKIAKPFKSLRRIRQRSFRTKTSEEARRDLLKKFHVTELLTESNSAQLYRGTCKKTNKKVIVKRTLKEAASPIEVDLAREAYRVCPQFTLPVLHYSVDEKYYTFVQEEFGCSLYDFMFNRQAALSLNEAKYVYKQVLVCLINLQNAGIFHLDIKEENILVCPETLSIRVIDFGVSRTGPVPRFRKVGSKEFYSPEILLGCSNYVSLPKHDVWSLGVAVYSSLTGKVPYENLEDLLSGRGQIDLSSMEFELQELFACVFKVDYQKRSGMENLLRCRFFS